jgi:hypothetical protein
MKDLLSVPKPSKCGWSVHLSFGSLGSLHPKFVFQPTSVFCLTSFCIYDVQSYSGNLPFH